MPIHEARQAAQEAKVVELETEMNLKIEEIARKFQAAIDALVESYDTHMKTIAPKPKLLPLRFNVVIQAKNNLKIENLTLK